MEGKKERCSIDPPPNGSRTRWLSKTSDFPETYRREIQLILISPFQKLLFLWKKEFSRRAYSLNYFKSKKDYIIEGSSILFDETIISEVKQSEFQQKSTGAQKYWDTIRSFFNLSHGLPTSSFAYQYTLPELRQLPGVFFLGFYQKLGIRNRFLQIVLCFLP